MYWLVQSRCAAGAALYWLVQSRCVARAALYWLVQSRCVAGAALYWFVQSRCVARAAMYWLVQSRCVAGAAMYWLVQSRCVAGAALYWLVQSRCIAGAALYWLVQSRCVAGAEASNDFFYLLPLSTVIKNHLSWWRRKFLLNKIFKSQFNPEQQNTQLLTPLHWQIQYSKLFIMLSLIDDVNVKLLMINVQYVINVFQV